MKLEITDSSILGDFDKASQLEWLETDGMGGYSSTTISGANTRRYHGLFVPAHHPPVGRRVMLSKLEETVATDSTKILLTSSTFPNYTYSKGLEYFNKFVKEIFPTFYYQVGNIEIKKTIGMIHEESVLAITYEVIQADKDFQLELKPFIAFRDFHSLSKANSNLNTEALFGNDILTINPYSGQDSLHIFVKNASFRFKPEWCMNFEYRVEQQRGLDFHEDLYQYGNFVCNLKTGDKLSVVVSIKEPYEKDAFKLLREEKRRRETLIEILPIKDNFTKNLALAADQFLVKRDNLKTIIAGYHWFADWGRDTMISLPGLCLVTGRYEEAKKILLAFAKTVDMGMIPNRFPDQGEAPEYNTVDATLWYFVAIKKYIDYSGDSNFVITELLPVLEEIIAWHSRGTRYNIHEAEDGLIYAGQRGVQLTWMDAKVGDWVVTPRQGKAVEINALWYNAIMIMCELYDETKNDLLLKQFTEKAEKIQQSFLNTFINPDGKSLYDFVDGGYKNSDIRPNQLFAISLPYRLVDDNIARKILDDVEEMLLTPVGLRSLAPESPQYIGHYRGDQVSRDGSYHQGTVWSWLLGPYLSSKIKVEGEAGRRAALKYLSQLENNLLEAGIGSISEIFDGNAPHKPNGCIAQAWGVAELLRVYIEDIYPQVPETLRKNK